jgi:hypothetical protein
VKIRRVLALLSISLLLLASCKSTTHGSLLRSEEMSILSWTEGRTLVVVLLDDEVDFSKDTLGLDLGAEIVVEAEDLLAIGRTLTLLARVVEGQPLLVVDGREQLNRLVASASSLRKTRLADTLAAVSGQNDPLSALERIQSVYLFDLRGKLDKTEQIDVYLTQFIEQAKRSVGRR